MFCEFSLPFSFTDKNNALVLMTRTVQLFWEQEYFTKAKTQYNKTSKQSNEDEEVAQNAEDDR